MKAKRIPRARQRQNRRGPAYPASRRQRYSCHRKKSHNEAGETPLRLLSFVKVSPPSLRTVADEGNRVFAAIRARARARDRRADPSGRTKAFNRRPEQIGPLGNRARRVGRRPPRQRLGARDALSAPDAPGGTVNVRVPSASSPISVDWNTQRLSYRQALGVRSAAAT